MLVKKKNFIIIHVKYSHAALRSHLIYRIIACFTLSLAEGVFRMKSLGRVSFSADEFGERYVM